MAEADLRICRDDPFRPRAPGESRKTAPLLCVPNGHGTLHVVTRGETLTSIVRDTYRLKDPAALRAAVARVHAENPQLRNPDRILPRQLLLLPSEILGPVGTRLNPAIWASAPTHRESMGALDTAWRQQFDPAEQDLVVALAPLLSIAGIPMSGVENAVSANKGLLKEIAQGYEAYRSGQMTKGQYDYLRRVKLRVFRDKLGPIGKLLYGSQSVNQAVRIRPGTAPLAHQLSQLGRWAKLASRGGAVLSVVELGIACREIGLTADRAEQNAKAVDAIGSSLVGAGAGWVIGIFLVSSPVGWGICLLAGLATAIIGAAGGYLMRRAYTRFGRHLDIIEALYIDRICT